MAALKTHLLKALRSREERIAAHHKEYLRRARTRATAADLAARAAGSATLPSTPAVPPQRKA